MRARNWTRLLAAVATCALLASPAAGQWLRPNDRPSSDVRRDERARRLPRGYQEPAYARGYNDGYARGAEDGRGRERYDPVRHKDYRDADEGYVRSYGSRDAYRNNYRTGFRQGYEDGYRARTR
jgi:hypothetical protein